MTKAEFIEQIKESAGLSAKDATNALKAITGTITDTLKKGESVQIVGFGTFEVAKREARKGRNPQTGKEIKIKARKVPRFRAGKNLKAAVN